MGKNPFASQPTAPPPDGRVADGQQESKVVQASDETWADKTKQTTKQAINLISGRELEDVNRGKQLYQEADARFREASNQPTGQRESSFHAAAKKFGKASEAAEGTAVGQDALFMQGESLFFADRLTEAAEVYQKLQKDYPRSRHNDRVAARLFAISQYWIDVAKAEEDSWFSINLTDPKRPRLDVDGHAIRVLDQIRYDDPSGRLADDATMAAAAEFIRQKEFDKADEFLTDLRETFTDSDHLFLAHMLGIRCKIEIYEGPSYSGLVLEEAEKLIQQTRQRFPNQASQEKYREMLARAAAEVSFLGAQRWATRAEYREKRKEYGAARFLYQQLLTLHPNTPQADQARERLAAIEQLPAVPPQRLAWLTTIFPDSSQSEPLKGAVPLDGQSDEPSPGGTMLR